MKDHVHSPSRYFFLLRGAAQPVVLSWVLFLLCALCVYMLTISELALPSATWADTARAATCLWLTSFGGRCEVGGLGYVQMMPLAITFLVGYALTVIGRKRLVHTWAEVCAVGALQAFFVAVVGLVMRVHGAWWISIFGAGIGGCLCAIWAGRVYLFESYRWFIRWEDVCEPRVRKFLGLFLSYSVVACTVAVLCGYKNIIAIHASYQAHIAGGIGLVLVQLLYLPTLFIWALNWIIGAGFAVGEGSYFSPWGAQLQPIPAIPVFGALPDTNRWALLVFVPVVLGILWRAVKDTADAADKSATRCFLDALWTILPVVCVITACGWLSRGALGGGRMKVVGTRPELLIAALGVITCIYVVAVMCIRLIRVLRMKKNSAEKGSSCEKQEGSSREKQCADADTRRDNENSKKVLSADAKHEPIVENEEHKNADSL